jgi:hypothetical protein
VRGWEKLINPLKNFSLYEVLWQSVRRITTGWTVRVSNLGGGELHSYSPSDQKRSMTCLNRPWSILNRPWSILYNEHPYKFIMCWMTIQYRRNLYTWKVLLNNPSINYSFPELFVALHTDVFCGIFLMFCPFCEYVKCMMWVVGLVTALVRCSFLRWVMNQSKTVRTLLSCGAGPRML